MRRFLAATTVTLLLLLSGCGVFRTKSSHEYDQAGLDQKLLEAAQQIARTQAELRGLATVSRAPDTAAPPRSATRPQGSKPITLEWQGDAAELMRVLADQQGVGFETRGVRVPLPVALKADHQPYNDVLVLLTAQLDYRAAIYPLPGKVVLEYLPGTGVVP